MRGRLPTEAVIRNGCVSCYHRTSTVAIIAASMCQKKLECLQLFSAAGRKQSQVKYKHTATCKNAQEEHRSVHRPVCSHSHKEDAKVNKQKMCLQVENVTKGVEYKTIWKQRMSLCRAEGMAAAFLFQG